MQKHAKQTDSALRYTAVPPLTTAKSQWEDVRNTQTGNKMQCITYMKKYFINFNIYKNIKNNIAFY